MSANLKVVISKLPYKLRERFRGIACDICETQRLKPNFNNVVHFVEKQVELLSDPIFGEIQMAEKGTHIKRDAHLVKQPIKLKWNLNNLATNVCAINKLQHKEMKEIKQNDKKQLHVLFTRSCLG